MLLLVLCLLDGFVTRLFVPLGDVVVAGRYHCLGMDGVLLAAREHAGQRRRCKVGRILALVMINQ